MKRVLIDLVYSVCIINARLQGARPTFSCFVDFQKAFVRSHNDLLSFECINSGIDVKFYNALEVVDLNPSCLHAGK